MQPYKKLSKGATLALFAAGLMATGGVASVGMQAFAQTSSTSSAPVAVTQAQDTTDNEANVVLPTGGITEAQARAAIMAKYPGVTIKQIELDNKNGSIVYGAELSDKSEVIVDAKTSAISQEPADHEGIDQQDKGGQNDANEAPGTETNDGPDGPNEAGGSVKK